MGSKRHTHNPFQIKDNPKAFMTRRQYKRFMAKTKPFPEVRPEQPPVFLGAAYNIKPNPKAFMTRQEYEAFMAANPMNFDWRALSPDKLKKLAVFSGAKEPDKK